MKQTKPLIMVVAPNDTNIGEAVDSWETERGYNVETLTITDLSKATEEILSRANHHQEDVRVLFTESAYLSIPRENRCLLIDTLEINPKIRWIHWAKKKKAKTKFPPRS